MENTYSYLQESYPRKYLEYLLEPERIVEANIEIAMDDWSRQSFQGWRSQHNNIKWPYKGGIRFHQDVSLDEVKSLSAWMTFKTSVVWLPLWWGKWWVIVNPKELSLSELERLSRTFIDEIREFIGPETDVPAPDVNTTSQIMWWMADQYALHVWSWKPWVITGKPLSIWGSAGRGVATALWWLYVLETYLDAHNQTLEWKKIVIQGAWNAWLTFAELVLEKWWIIVGMSDSRWGVYNNDWLSVDELRDLKLQRKSVTEYTWDCRTLSAWEILVQEANILVPAALENQLTEENAAQIQAQVVLELANGPTTPQADKLLYSHWVVVLPDILANAGWVTVSYFEQVQNNTNYYWPEEEVFEKLKTKMMAATDRVINMWKFHEVSLRDAAYIVSMKKLFEAMQARGK